MKKVIVRAIFAGATVFSLVIVTSFGCGEQDQLGKGGNAGGSAGVPNIKLDGSVSGNGSSGGGGSGGAPSTSTNCGSQTSSTTHEPPDVLLVLDRSSSMYYTISQDCFCSQADATAAGTSYTACANAGSADCQTRWSAVQPAVINTVANSKDVNWGLKFFPTPNAAQCSVSSSMEVQIGPNTADAVRSAVESATVSLSTPTASALKAATTYLGTVNDNRPKFILLATDGEPNCRGGQIMNTDLDGASAAAKAAYDAGYPVYVIGIGPNLGNLSQIAAAGGTDDYYPVASPQQLVDAFAAIKQLVASCTFTLGATPANADINKLAVYLDKNLLKKDDPNGWRFGGGQQSVVLQGDACDKLTTGKASTVEVYYGCGEAPPPKIP